MNASRNLFSITWYKNNASKLVLGGLVLLIGIFFYLLNVLYPIYLDDWFYSFNLANGKPIDGILDILESEYAHYYKWGGRVVLHSIAQFMLWLGESWANVLNTLAYLSLVLLMYSVANKGNKTNLVLFLFVNIFIWFSLPSLSQNLLWTTGSANYLWGCLILFSFIWFYVSSYIGDGQKDTLFQRLGLFCLGVFAGWTNENMGVALIFFLFGLLALLRLQKRDIPKWMILGLIGAVVGCAFMLLAPGNAIRSKNDLWVAHHLREANLSFYFYRFVTVVKLSFVYILIPCVIYLLSLVLCWLKGKREKKKEYLSLSLLLFSSSIVATCVMAGAPMFPERTWFGILILLITAWGVLFANIDLSGKKVGIASYTVFTVAFIIYLISYFENYSELARFSEMCQRRDIMIETEKRKGIEDIVITDELFKQKDSRLIVLDLQDWLVIDPAWDTRLGKYKGVKTIIVKENKANPF
ncbi:DUF6056 family protein [Dysgonomonas sp. BGC7]|uniref:DUF3329 domain-containing protein n=1 Tax=Dysgonomonas sp. BGC7 TaxID=1658008 RepID=UPI0006809F94|nr:DUF6056 family protein [Dysgonomonas sp. BGC7]MBD8389885.1 hypothetical protein [Dysgonomonas sp. BGC7]